MVGRSLKKQKQKDPAPEMMARIISHVYPESTSGTKSAYGVGSVEALSRAKAPFTRAAKDSSMKILGKEFIILEKAETTSPEAYLLADQDRSFAVVAIRGAEPTNAHVKNGTTDLEYATGQVLVQAQVVGETFRCWRGKHKKSIPEWGVVGHGLGGMNAQYVLVEHGNDIAFAYNFSGSEMYPLFSSEHKRQALLHGDKLHNIGSQRDRAFMFNRELENRWGIRHTWTL